MTSTTTAVPLSSATLAAVGERVPVPTYDRSQVTPGIVHLGVGGFHRAHQAMYLDRLMEAGQALDWGIRGIGVLPHDARMKEVMDAQDGLYTLVLKHPDGTREPRVVGSILDFLLAPEDPDAAIEAMADPRIRIVSLTITEGGYNIDAVTHEFLLDEPGVAADLADGAVPRTAFGLVVEALRRRRERGVTPFTLMSCDNLPGNGDLARHAFVAFATARDAELGAWVDTRVAFPNTMVDRITPGTTDADRAEVRERFGVQDAWPVVCEPFTQWVVQDDFPLGRPPLEEVGVQVVEDVEPYELMKLRLLNASHQALCYFGHLAGYRLVHEVVQDPLFERFLRGYMAREGVPSVPPVPGMDLEAYCDELIVRFSNGEVRDTVARLCNESSDRIPKWLLPVVRHQLASGGEFFRGAAVVASWARYAEGVDEQGEPIEVADRLAERVVAAAQRNRAEPTAFIADRTLFGDLVDDERFVAEYTATLASLHERGARATLEALVAR
ncbi:mannitol dehydrogenase family protein [Kineococcus sp. T13]|uniref:mannitol dehydrogenase family protein n=1 Tax=Kineococcus vitellinus TaxID=2696565 RepID=UPI00141203D7|nr:mannitol dehydrogenase family protein [Kineococcus vitellinus]